MLRVVKKRPFVLGLALAALGCGAVARADEPPPPGTAGIPELIGARGLAMGAYRGVAAGNDGIFTNAASLAARRRYAIETQWMLDRVAGSNAFQAYGASVVDSQTGSVAGGFAYTRVLSGPEQGNLFHVAFAFPLTEGLYLGAAGKYESLEGPLARRDVRAGTVDVGAFWQASSLISLGVSGYNLVDTAHRAIMPRGVGAGLALGDDRRYHVAADWRGDFDRKDGTTTNLYAAGAEVLVGDLMPVRAGYVRDETRGASYWSAGLGLVTTSGFAVDASFRQRIERSDDRTFAIGLKLFLLSLQ